MRAISVCAGQGHNVIGALAEHPRRAVLSVRLVELDEHIVRIGRQPARTTRLERIERLWQGDAR